jgi:RHS repeat-associated protein
MCGEIAMRRYRYVRTRRSSRRAAGVLVLTLVLTLTGIPALERRQASAAPARGVDPHRVPVLSSGRAPDRAADPARPRGDFTPLSGTTASRFDPERSRLVSRSMFVEEYVNPDGTRTMRQSTVPLNVLTADGQWHAVQTDLEPDTATGRSVARWHPLSPSLAGRADDAALVSVRVGDAEASLALEQAAASRATTRGAKSTYADALPGTDLVYEVTADSVKETILLKRVAAVGPATWRFRLGTRGLTPELDRSGAVLLRDGNGVVKAFMPPVQAWDSSGDGGRGPAVTGGRYRLERAGAGWVLTVSVDESWLRDRARVYPVHVDPTWTLGVTDSYAYKSDGYWCHYCGLKIGNSLAAGDTYWRSVFHVDYTPLFGRTVVGARLDLTQDPAIPAQSYRTWNADLYHATALGFNGVGEYMGSGLVGGVGSISGSGLTNYLRGRVDAGDPTAYFMLVGSELAGTWTYKTLSQATLLVDTGSAPPATSIVAPADGSVITSLTPTLSVNPVSNPSGDPVSYCFKIATGPDAKTGVVVDSGCLANPTWTVPDGVLQDGVAYTWQATTVSGITTTVPSWIGHLRVDQRIGAHGPSPEDSVGPVSVNLANGDIGLSDAGPSFAAVGGNAGLTFTYHSQQKDNTGLRASYFNDLSHNGNISPDQQPVLVRTEPQVNVDWGVDSPFPPALPASYFVVRWEGSFRPPATGTYLFAGVHRGSATVWINGNQVYTASGPSDVNWTQTTPVSLTAGVVVSIKVELAKTTGAGQMRLFTKTTDGTTVPAQLVPSSWLYTGDVPALPQGWTLSADLDGSGLTYVTAKVADQTVVFTDAAGTKHSWTKRGTGGYAPPPGEDGTLGIDTAGRVTLTEGADVYVFNADGTLATQASSVDAVRPAALRNTYDGNPRRLAQITDPVSGRTHVLHYNRSGDDCYGGAPVPAGADPAAPGQMLCRITYWDGSETRLWYCSALLCRVENPGADINDFGYNPTGLLDRIRGPLAVDWVSIDPAARQTDDTLTKIDYDTSTGKPKATRVMLPMPAPGEASLRPAHSYRYDPANRRTDVDIAGLTPPTGFASEVTYDDADRTLTTTNSAGNVESRTWSVKDQLLTSTDAAGRVSSTIYDYADRPVDSYGPAPGSCFTGQLPTTACATTVAHAHTSYDEGLAGLSATFYDNPDLTGAPKDYVTGVGTSDGRLSASYGGPIVGLAGKCLDVRNMATDDGTPVQLWTCNGTDAQRWTRNGDTIRALGKCLDAQWGGTSDGTPVWLWTCNGGGAQNWVAQPDGSFVNPQSNKCLDVQWGATGDGTPIQLWTCNGGGAQRWTLPANQGAPRPTVPSVAWSARFTGEIQFPATGAYALGFNVIDGVRLWVDDTLVVDGWTDHPVTASLTGTYTNTAAASWHRIRVDYYNRGGNGLLNFTWSPPGQTWQVVPGQYLRPRYGLTTSTTVSESNGIPDRTTATRYTDNGVDPASGLPTSTVIDPAGLNLGHATAYETPGTGYRRKLTGTDPAGGQTTLTYYGDSEQRDNPCTPANDPANQAGMVKTSTDPPAANGSHLTRETVYDAAGRTVATRTNADPWTCTSYDARDRITSRSIPAYGSAPGRTVTYNYAVGGDPLTTSVADPAGTITTTVDLLGRTTRYTDTTGAATTTFYDQAGHPTTVTSAVGTRTSTVVNTYDTAGRLATLSLDGQQVAAPAYNPTTGELSSVTYGNNTSLSQVDRGQNGATTGLTWTLAGTAITDTSTRSRAGTIATDSVTRDGTAVGSFAYTYDAAGRLTQAQLPHHVQQFAFAASGGCGANPAAGRNTNRTALTDTLDGTTTTTNYCYDNADRLTAATGAGATTFGYDGHGNTATIGSVTYAYDGGNRHVGSYAGNVAITYVRDATDRLVSRTVSGAAPSDNGTWRYAYSGDGDSTDLVLDANVTLVERQLPLPGGVLLTKTYPSGTTNWSYPNIHGDIIVTADNTGTLNSVVYLYDPYGRTIDLASGALWDPRMPQTSQGGFDYGWLGQHQRPGEHVSGYLTIEMGARPYLPSLGRFLAVDPVEGGSANDYDYVYADPVNKTDLDGKCWRGFGWVCRTKRAVGSAWHHTTSGISQAWHHTTSGISRAWHATTSGISRAWHATTGGIGRAWRATKGWVSRTWHDHAARAVACVERAWDLWNATGSWPGGGQLLIGVRALISAVGCVQAYVGMKAK